MQEKGTRRYRILVRRNEKAIRHCSALVNWQMDIGSGKKVEDRRKGFNIALNLTILRHSCTFEQSKDIQEVQSILQDHVLLPEGFTEYLYHVRNRNELMSIVNHSLMPGGVSLKTGRQAVFFTVANPMDNQDGLGETHCDLSKARSAPNKNTRKHFSGYSILVQFWSSLDKEDCNFIKQDQTQLFSTTHCLKSSLRKRYAWRLRISFIKEKAWF